MENSSSEHTPAAEVPVEKTAPVRRSRRATAATGEAVATPAVAAAPASQPASAAAAEPAAAEAAPVKRATRARTSKAAAARAAAAESNGETTDSAAPVAAQPAAEVPAPTTTDAEPAAAPKKRVTRSRKKASEAEALAAELAAAAPAVDAAEGAAPAVASATDLPTAESVTESGAEPAPEAAPKKRQTRGRKKAAEVEAAAAPTETADTVAGEAAATPAAETAAAPVANEKNTRSRTRNGQNRRGNNTAAEANAGSDATADATEASPADAKAEAKSSDTKQHDTKQNDAKSGDANTRTNRTRQRERKRRGQGEDFELELNEDDVLLPIAGILDVLDNYAFVRTSGYLPGTNDVYVSLGQVKKYDLRKGDAVVGAIRQPRENDGNGRQKYNAIVRVDSVNARPTDDPQARVNFADLTAIPTDTQLQLETQPTEATGRVLDLFAPLGAGQRALVRGGTGTGKTSLLRQIATAVSHNQPNAHLMFVAIDARPEEVTELQRTVNGEVIASGFDRPVEDHITAAELAVERAKRLVELGHDVVVLLDTVTRLGRAYQQSALSHTRGAAAGIEISSLAPMKRLLAAALNVENGGSLTIVASANDQSVSQTDELILEEFAGVWNSLVVLSPELARLGAFPAIDVAASHTRNAAALHGADAAAALVSVRRAAAELGAIAADAALQVKLAAAATNVEFLALAQRKPGL